MGMGKTLQAIAMILKRRTEELEKLPEDEREGVRYTTLVVTPVVALSQWVKEIDKYTKPGSLKVILFIN